MKRINGLTAAALAMQIGAGMGQADPRDKGAGTVSRDLQGASRNQYDHLGRRLHIGCEAHGGAAEVRRLSRRGHACFVPEEHPKEGGLLAVLHGWDPSAKAILMLAHVDVVEAKREDWTRDPFTLIEEDGYFYGRGTSDICPGRDLGR